jgi:chitodextrinase
MFDEAGVVTTSTNRVTLSPLTPDTTYRFRVSAITQDQERGAEVLISGTTTEATGGK